MWLLRLQLALPCVRIWTTSLLCMCVMCALVAAMLWRAVGSQQVSRCTGRRISLHHCNTQLCVRDCDTVDPCQECMHP